MKWIPAVLALPFLVSCSPSAVDTSAIQTQTAESNAYTVLSRRGYSENVLMRFRDAESSYRETALIAGELFPDDRVGIAEQQIHLALNKSNLGEYELADSIFAVSRPIINELGGPVVRMKGMVFYSQHLMNQFRATDAEQEADRAISLATRFRGDANVVATNTDATVRTNTFRVTPDDAARLESRSESALGLELDASTLTAEDQMSILEANALYVKAASLVGQGKTGSRALIEAAGQKLDATPENTAFWLRGEVYATRASAAEQDGELEMAAKLVREALRVTKGYAAGERPEALAHLQLGRVLLKLGRDSAARTAFINGITILSRGGRGVAYEELSGYLDLLAASPGGDTDRLAFTALQQLRSPVTSDTLSQLAARLASGTSEKSKAIRAFQDNERAVNRLTARIDQLTASPTQDVHGLNVRRARLVEAQAALEASRASLNQVAPNYGQIVDGSISLETLRGLLLPNETFIIVRLGENRGTVAAISQSDFSLKVLPVGRAEIGALVQRVRDSVLTIDFDVAAARDLYKIVITPVESMLGENASVTFAPDGPLLSMPANLMIDQEPTAWAPGSLDFSSVSWFGTSRAISITMSPQSFVSLRQASPSRAKQPFRGFGGFQPFGVERATVVNQARGVDPSCLPISRALGQLAPLAGTADEVERLRQIFGSPASATILGPQFTDKAITDQRMDDTRILHFASHALLPLSEACLNQPTIVTSLGQSGSDALLDAGEIVDLALDADLVVLSACDTGGIGSATPVATGLRTNRGEGLSGLVRAFFFSGARNVVASHWVVPDEETVKLMVAFYGNAVKGSNFAEAMRDARTTLARDPFTSHPRNWSAFSVIGDGKRSITQ